MINIILGLCLMCLGIAGIVCNWWAVMDFVRVVLPVALLVFGVLALLAGLKSPNDKP